MQELNQRFADTPYIHSFAYGNNALLPKQVGAVAHNAQGIVHAKNDEYDLAITHFCRAIRLAPDYAEAYCNRGIIYDNRGQVDRAIENYNKAIQLKPDCAEAYCNRGVAYHKESKHDLAIEDYNKAIELNPDFATVYHNRGNAYHYIGEMEKAIADYSQAIVLKPKVAESYYTRGEAWLRIEKWEEAQRDLTAAILQGVDIADKFHNTHNSIVAFEKETVVKLPEDIVELLTPRKEPFEIDKETRIALAMKYYENEELSSGLAAHLAGVSREEFWYLMGDYGLSLFGTAEDLQEELENARKTSYQ